MPIFEYRCADCGAVTEFLIGVTAEKTKLCCRKCQGTKLEKVFSRTARVRVTGGIVEDPVSSCRHEGGPCNGDAPCGEPCDDFSDFDDYDA